MTKAERIRQLEKLVAATARGNALRKRLRMENADTRAALKKANAERRLILSLLLEDPGPTAPGGKKQKATKKRK